MTEPYRIFPHATTQERADLRASIKAVGLSCPVILDEHGNIIDGHERRSICADLGIDWMAGADVRIGLSEYQKKALAIELNMWRRPMNLTRRQRNEFIDIYLIANSHLSDQMVADLFGVNQSTVHRRKRALVENDELPKITATVGKDGVTRQIGNRQKTPTRLIVKSRAEFASLQPAMEILNEDLTGHIRRPNKLFSLARRKTALAKVNDSPKMELPQSCRIEHSDFRDLNLDDNSVDVILTDVVWMLSAEQDWRDLARLAKRWLRDDGIFCSMVGSFGESSFRRAIEDELKHQATIAIVFPTPSWSVGRGIGKQWRPAVIFAKSNKFVLPPITDVILVPRTADNQKDYHDWQQRLDVCTELMKRLTKQGDVIVDPHLGTGTNAVAAALLGERTFVGCDIDEQQVRTARYRVATEGHLTTVNSLYRQFHEVTA